MAAKPGKSEKTATLKSIITDLHSGLSVREAKERFESEIGDISSTEIAELEQGLIDEGMKPEIIQQFCNVHALLFESALQKATAEETSPSHPIALFRAENTAIERRLAEIRETAGDTGALEKSDDLKIKLMAQLLDLKSIETHYARKENVLFPHLEKVGFVGPSKVMWGKDDEVRGLLKSALDALQQVGKTLSGQSFVTDSLDPLLKEIEGMIFKEENILFPAALEKLDPSLWVEILKESEEVGYVFIEKPAEIDELLSHPQTPASEASLGGGTVGLPSGSLDVNELLSLFNTLPVDLTFVDSEDRVKYFSESPERIFARPRSIVGRKVQNCHPPQSLGVVEKILKSFKDGSRDSYEFWLQMGGKFIHIRYFALRDETKRYLGCLEVSQDLTPLRALEGEKRLLDEPE